MKDYDSAAKIKESLLKLYRQFDSFKLIQGEMRKAAAEEEYTEASRLKTKRDSTRGEMMETLNFVETSISVYPLPSKSQNESLLKARSKPEYPSSIFEDLSLSTIHRPKEDDDETLMTGPFDIEDRPIRPFKKNDGDDKSLLHHFSMTEPVKSTEKTKCSFEIEDRPILSQERDHGENMSMKESIETTGQNGKHPLDGVPGFEKLPTPEEMYRSHDRTLCSVSTTNSHTSSDSMTKIESTIGEYLTRCVFSKEWKLREAALTKISLVLNDLFSNEKNESSPKEIDWRNHAHIKTISVILERTIDDNVIQVYLTALILLDDCVDLFFSLKIAQKDIIHILGTVVITLVGKLGDRSAKVVEGAGTALMSLAYCDSVGPAFIASQSMKNMTCKDSKAGQSLSARFNFLKGLVEEFNEEAPKGGKVIDFVKTYGIGHKDIDVRDAAKELATAIYIRDGGAVLSMLDGLSDRQIKEYKSAFSNATKQKERKEERRTDDRKRNMNTPSYPKKMQYQTDNNDNYQRLEEIEHDTPQHAVDEIESVLRKGRGRGRGRMRIVKNQSNKNAFM